MSSSILQCIYKFDVNWLNLQHSLSDYLKSLRQLLLTADKCRQKWPLFVSGLAKESPVDFSPEHMNSTFPISAPCFLLVFIWQQQSVSSSVKQKYSIDWSKKATFSSFWYSGYHETGRAWGREASVVCKISLM